jgi:hypothetical protein
MFRWGFQAAVLGVGLLSLTATAQAQLGDLSGTFDITVRQGGSVIAFDTVTIGLGGDLVDLQGTFQDGDPEDFTPIGTIGLTGAPIILKVTTDGDSGFRASHWYIDVPVSLADIYSPGPTSLFDPLGGSIDVTIDGLSFDNGAAGIPLIVANNSFAVSFMRDALGMYYELPGSRPYNAYGYGVNDIQVPGETYCDADLGQYTFEVLQTGTSVSWRWSDILPATLATKVHDGTSSGVTPLVPGHVFELGLGMAFVPVPEPGTLLLVLGGWTALMCRTRIRRWRQVGAEN